MPTEAVKRSCLKSAVRMASLGDDRVITFDENVARYEVVVPDDRKLYPVGNSSSLGDRGPRTATIIPPERILLDSCMALRNAKELAEKLKHPPVVPWGYPVIWTSTQAMVCSPYPTPSMNHNSHAGMPELYDWDDAMALLCPQWDKFEQFR